MAVGKENKSMNLKVNQEVKEPVKVFKYLSVTVEEELGERMKNVEE